MQLSWSTIRLLVGAIGFIITGLGLEACAVGSSTTAGIPAAANDVSASTSWTSAAKASSCCLYVGVGNPNAESIKVFDMLPPFKHLGDVDLTAFGGYFAVTGLAASTNGSDPYVEDLLTRTVLYFGNGYNSPSTVAYKQQPHHSARGLSVYGDKLFVADAVYDATTAKPAMDEVKVYKIGSTKVVRQLAGPSNKGDSAVIQGIPGVTHDDSGNIFVADAIGETTSSGTNWTGIEVFKYIHGKGKPVITLYSQGVIFTGSGTAYQYFKGSIIVDSSGNVLIGTLGTQGCGFYIYPPGKSTLSRYIGEPSGDSQTVDVTGASLSDSHLYMADGKRLNVYTYPRGQSVGSISVSANGNATWSVLAAPATAK